jgi:UDP:flavonoid glycosyltransferase YjiC (YdhE family)
MNCLFIIQGEGRGHLTQALALASMLRRAGHRVCGALVGRSSRRELPAFFTRKLGAPVETFDSPNFVSDARDRAVRLLPSVLQAVQKSPVYRASLLAIGTHLDRYRPDLAINFFEPLAGLYYAWHHPPVPMVCIGHQYLAHHPTFPFPPNRALDRWALRQFSNVTALGAVRRLALSFTPLPDVPGRRLTVVPPLLRAELFDQPVDVREPFLLAYLLNSGYADEIERWHRRHPSVVVHCFWDNREAPETHTPAPNLTQRPRRGARRRRPRQPDVRPGPAPHLRRLLRAPSGGLQGMGRDRIQAVRRRAGSRRER